MLCKANVVCFFVLMYISAQFLQPCTLLNRLDVISLAGPPSDCLFFFAFKSGTGVPAEAGLKHSGFGSAPNAAGIRTGSPRLQPGYRNCTKEVTLKFKVEIRGYGSSRISLVHIFVGGKKNFIH